ncbi:AraC family transcriptional regulator [Pseudomonas protegens]|uniref:AraC family transcriptional regulator n=1 Tax=Pseudomonas protegens TaxID=380021 RepID=UPI0027463E41|nr:AraC family transcriptional regulator [Pseudomonas protegens]MDP9502388.1 AraC family transcriptional regulator [Pseudomonas protegens]
MTISVAQRSYSGEVELHAHDYPQIVLPQFGSMEIEVEGRAGRVDWSQGVLIHPSARHSFLSQNQNRFLVLDLPDSDSLDTLQPETFFTIGPALRHLLEYARHNPAIAAESDLTVKAWSSLVLSSLSIKQPPPPRQQALSRALNHIQKNLSSPLSAHTIALAAGISERQLYLLFERYMGCSPFAHITQLRLNCAIEMLSTSHLPISEIAQRVGYADQSALTHALKKARQLTPGTLRRQAFNGSC